MQATGQRRASCLRRKTAVFENVVFASCDIQRADEMGEFRRKCLPRGFISHILYIVNVALTSSHDT